MDLLSRDLATARCRGWRRPHGGTEHRRGHFVRPVEMIRSPTVIRVSTRVGWRIQEDPTPTHWAAASLYPNGKKSARVAAAFDESWEVGGPGGTGVSAGIVVTVVCVVCALVFPESGRRVRMDANFSLFGSWRMAVGNVFSMSGTSAPGRSPFRDILYAHVGAGV